MGILDSLSNVGESIKTKASEILDSARETWETGKKKASEVQDYLSEEWRKFGEDKLYEVNGGGVVLWDKKKYEETNPKWEWPRRDVEVGDKIVRDRGNIKPLWTRPPARDKRIHKIDDLKDGGRFKKGKYLFGGIYDKKEYIISEVSAYLNGKGWVDGFMFLIYEGIQQYRIVRLKNTSKWIDRGHEVKEPQGDKVYLWDKALYEANHLMWDWPYEHIGNVDDKNNKDANKKMSKPVVGKHNIMNLADETPFEIGNYLYGDNNNNKEGNLVCEIRVKVTEKGETVWKEGFMYLIYKGREQYRQLIKNRNENGKQQDKGHFIISNKNENVATGKGPVPFKPVTDSDARVTSVFGSRWGKFHGGIDIATLNKDKVVKVYAAYDGEVVYIGADPKRSSKEGYGYYIIIKGDNGYYHLYGHLKDGSAVVGREDQVKAGDELAIMGYTGHCEPSGKGGTHLHFGMSKQYGKEKEMIDHREGKIHNPIDVQKFYPLKE
ncbi:MAG: M23 family metallopeptidase [Candidatus Cloacimonetes bacterium]|nr:M23 family metallopeptidase [Candidatus Cloacimonadota bacterium]